MANSKENRFTFLCNDKERQMIADIAHYMDRSQGDAIRLLIKRAASQIEANITNGQQDYAQKIGDTWFPGENTKPQQKLGALNGDRYPHRASEQSISKNHYTPVYQRGKIVGNVEQGTFIKKVNSKIHFFYKHGGYACGIESLKNAIAAGADTVKLIVDGGKIVYQAPIALFYSKGIEFEWRDEKQICLPIEHWTEGNQPPLFPTPIGGAQ